MEEMQLYYKSLFFLKKVIFETIYKKKKIIDAYEWKCWNSLD